MPLFSFIHLFSLSLFLYMKMHLNSGTFLCYGSGGRGLLVKLSFCSRMYVILTLLSLQNSQQRSPITHLNDVI